MKSEVLFPGEHWAASSTSVRSSLRGLGQEAALWLHWIEFGETGNGFFEKKEKLSLGWARERPFNELVLFSGNRHNQKKELESRLASLRSSVESGQADEDQIREFYLLQIRQWIHTSLEEIESIDQEMVILRSRGPAKQV